MNPPDKTPKITNEQASKLLNAILGKGTAQEAAVNSLSFDELERDLFADLDGKVTVKHAIAAGDELRRRLWENRRVIMETLALAREFVAPGLDGSPGEGPFSELDRLINKLNGKA